MRSKVALQARSAPMAEAYRRLWKLIIDRYAKDMLSPFFRYLSGIGVSLTDVNDDHVAEYFQ